METKLVCPLGCECQKAVDGYIEQCAWYIKMQGSDPQSGKPIDEYRCSIAWQPILLVAQHSEMAQTNASVQSLRNETVARQDKALETINAKINKSI